MADVLCCIRVTHTDDTDDTDVTDDTDDTHTREVTRVSIHRLSVSIHVCFASFLCLLSSRSVNKPPHIYSCLSIHVSVFMYTCLPPSVSHT
jgi:hypothetical protein